MRAKREAVCKCGCPYWKHGRNPGDRFLLTGKCDTANCNCTGYSNAICDKCNAEIDDGECNCTLYAKHPEVTLTDPESLARCAKIRELAEKDFPELFKKGMP